jgi:septal ring factor EnvC (AmiA/AmiB activator)
VSSPNRKQSVDMEPLLRPGLAVATETLRSKGEACHTDAAPPRGEEKISVFWRVFGGTLLSIAALVVMTVYQQVNASITELRAAVARVNETHADLAKKEELNSRTSKIWDTLTKVTTDLPAMKTHDDILDSQFKTAEQERKELCARIQVLNERLVKLEAIQSAMSAKVSDGGKSHKD